MFYCGRPNRVKNQLVTDIFASITTKFSLIFPRKDHGHLKNSREGVGQLGTPFSQGRLRLTSRTLTGSSLSWLRSPWTSSLLSSSGSGSQLILAGIQRGNWCIYEKVFDRNDFQTGENDGAPIGDCALQHGQEEGQLLPCCEQFLCNRLHFAMLTSNTVCNKETKCPA